MIAIRCAGEASFGVKIGRGLIVLDRTHVDTKERIALLVRRLLAKRAIERPVGPDDDLSASGLSSLDLVNLMLSVETELDVKIPDREMTPANFRSIARIEALVRTLADKQA
jgi:acyl carrier protein